MPEQLHDRLDQEKSAAELEMISASSSALPAPLSALKSDNARVAPPERLRETNEIAKVDEPLPPDPVKSERPEERELIAQPEQVAIVTELSSGEEKMGGNAQILGIYMGKINAKVQRAKVNPRSQQTGRVLLRFTVATDGSLVSKQVESSSGYQVLDDAALAAIERAAPFPAVPAEVGLKPMTFTQVFRFIVR
ncbi:energy transducer TonB [Hyphomicrobium methylovorum]|nr:energy transducer TonB [Hyphomicrobium methylovorum]